MRHQAWGQSASGWQCRLQASLEDSGALIVSILLHCPDQKICAFQSMIHAWRNQSPFTYVCLTEHPNIYLQIKGLPDLHTKHNLKIDFPRSTVHIPIFRRATGLDANWAKYRILNIALHLGDGPSEGHYSLWMADDDKLP